MRGRGRTFGAALPLLPILRQARAASVRAPKASPLPSASPDPGRLWRAAPKARPSGLDTSRGAAPTRLRHWRSPAPPPSAPFFLRHPAPASPPPARLSPGPPPTVPKAPARAAPPPPHSRLTALRANCCPASAPSTPPPSPVSGTRQWERARGGGSCRLPSSGRLGGGGGPGVAIRARRGRALRGRGLRRAGPAWL